MARVVQDACRLARVKEIGHVDAKVPLQPDDVTV